MQIINEKEIVTSNKSKFVKIWNRTAKKPEILQFDEFKNKKVFNRNIQYLKELNTKN